MEINTKRDSYEYWNKGFFGNKLKSWDSIEEIQKSSYYGTVTMRYKGGSRGKDLYSYETPLSQIPIIQKEWIKKGAKEKLITFNESAPDDFILMQGEVISGCIDHYYLFYSLEKGKMNEVLKNGKSEKGVLVKSILEHYLNPLSHIDMLKLFDLFPEHAIEFSTYSKNLGNLPGRNTIIWEVRKY